MIREMPGKCGAPLKMKVRQHILLDFFRGPHPHQYHWAQPPDQALPVQKDKDKKG